MSTAQLREDLAIPYVVVMSTVQRDGVWIRRAEYPELPGCFVESRYALDAMDQLEEKRIRLIRQLHQEGKRVPRPRPPLKSTLARLNALAGS